jgi:thiamine biosynthesis lipoprotein
MACRAAVHAPHGSDAISKAAIAEALACFVEVDRTCTRFDPDSPLMRANRSPNAWHRVPELLYRSVREAHGAYQRTRGLFDPRVLRDLEAAGYNRSLRFGEADVTTPECVAPRAAPRPWRPGFRGNPLTRLRLGGDPIDLGGIGKGLAIRWAAQRLSRESANFLVEAGGDCLASGCGPDGPGWRVGIEDPRGDVDADPLVVVQLRDLACTTSSVRFRRWRCNGTAVHHIIDPRTGRPGGDGLLAVSVLAEDPADAEVTSKTLFLRGAYGIGRAAARKGVAAFWVGRNGEAGATPAFLRHVIWTSA